MDSRGHGRSSRDARPFGYDLMADDVVALMDTLGVPRADVVGWSDGGSSRSIWRCDTPIASAGFSPSR